MRLALRSDTASEAQKNYIKVLLDKLEERNLDVWVVANDWVSQRWETLTIDEADRTIKALKNHVYGNPIKYVQVNFNSIPEGRYAVDRNGKLGFYLVRRSDNGGTYLKQYASDALYPVPGSLRNWVLTQIAKDPKTAANRYSDETRSCWKCGRTLTDEESRARRMGPDCYAKYR